MYYIAVQKSLVILGCSDRKRLTSRPLRAVERYDGPTFRVLRRHVRETPQESLHIRILSARFGLIPDDAEIPRYNRSLNGSDKAEFRLRVEVQVRQALRDVQPERVFVSLGSRYWPLVERPLTNTIASAQLFVAAGGIGGRASQLAWWLGRTQNAVPDSVAEKATGVATLLGTTVRLSAREVLRAANDARALNPIAARRFETWYVPVGTERVAPKWLVSVVFRKPVARFRTADARRVLALLGVDCVYDSSY
jgi:hypothetical protein